MRCQAFDAPLGVMPVLTPIEPVQTTTSVVVLIVIYFAEKILHIMTKCAMFVYGV